MQCNLKGCDREKWNCGERVAYYSANLAILLLVVQLKELTVVELKSYLAAHNLPVSGKKEDLIKRISSHMGK